GLARQDFARARPLQAQLGPASTKPTRRGRAAGTRSPGDLRKKPDDGAHVATPLHYEPVGRYPPRTEAVRGRRTAAFARVRRDETRRGDDDRPRAIPPNRSRRTSSSLLRRDQAAGQSPRLG